MKTENPLARYAEREKSGREVPVPPYVPGKLVARAVLNSEYRRSEAKRQKALKALQRAKDLEDELYEQVEIERQERVRRERVERAMRTKRDRPATESPEARKERFEDYRERLREKALQRAKDFERQERDEERVRRAREKWRKREKEQWLPERSSAKVVDPDPFGKPQTPKGPDKRPPGWSGRVVFPNGSSGPRTMPYNLDYERHRQLATIRRGGVDPTKTKLVRALRTSAGVGRAALRALPVVGAIATAYDVANILGGPPTKDPTKFRNYKGFPGTTRPPEVKK